MAVYSGKNGSLKFDNVTAARVRNWSFTSTAETLDVTDLGEDARKYTAGLKTATGQASIFYHDDNTSLAGILNNVITTGTPVAGILKLRWGPQELEFAAFVTSATVTCSTGEVMSADISFQMTGDYRTIKL